MADVDDRESLVELRHIVLDLTDYIEHDDPQIERLRALGDRWDVRLNERPAEDRQVLSDLEAIYLELCSYGNLASERERLAVVHRRLKAQFSQRYGERP